MKKLFASGLALILALSFMVAVEAADDVFGLFEGIPFTFSSGAGGWWTEIEVSGDGSFTGYFHDSDMGDVGDDYPEGTLYECFFSGTFVVTKQIDSYTYQLLLTALNIEDVSGEERIVDRMRIISGDAYGVAGGDVFLLYCPGRETADLPEGFLEWICLPNAWENAPETLPFYGLYNVEESTGFFSEYVGNTFDEYAELAGAWQTAEDDEGFITLLLYPEDAFRLYQYNASEDETFMLEGIYVVKDNVIIVSEIRLGMLDAEGRYTQIGEKEIARFIFSLDHSHAPMLTLTNEQEETITFHPVDIDAPG